MPACRSGPASPLRGRSPGRSAWTPRRPARRGGRKATRGCSAGPPSSCPENGRRGRSPRPRRSAPGSAGRSPGRRGVEPRRGAPGSPARADGRPARAASRRRCCRGARTSALPTASGGRAFQPRASSRSRAASTRPRRPRNAATSRITPGRLSAGRSSAAWKSFSAAPYWRSSSQSSAVSGSRASSSPANDVSSETASSPRPAAWRTRARTSTVAGCLGASASSRPSSTPASSVRPWRSSARMYLGEVARVARPLLPGCAASVVGPRPIRRWPPSRPARRRRAPSGRARCRSVQGLQGWQSPPASGPGWAVARQDAGSSPLN